MEYKWRVFSPFLMSVFATSDGKNLWAVGEGGTILHSTDGETWKPQASSTTNHLNSVYGTSDGKSLWAVGDRGTILHSTDGETWHLQTSNTTDDLNSVYAAGDGKGLWAVGDSGTILHSTDGETWKPQASSTTNYLNSVYAASDGKSLWVVGTQGTILHSKDGETWKPQTSNTYAHLSSVFTTSDGKNIWAVGEEGTILHSTDGGTWKPQISTTKHRLLSVYGTGDGKSLWAVGDSGTILHSTDGETWKPQASSTTNYLNSVYAASDGKSLWAVGTQGTILHSVDGETWKPQTGNPIAALRSVYATSDGKNLWAVGDAGTILHSTDGETWKTQTSNTALNLWSVYGTSDGKNLWAVGDKETILHSTDGETWEPQTINYQLLSMYGTSEGKNLWAVGFGGTILHSTDGETWKPQTSNTTSDLRSVYATSDGKNLWAVGSGGTILHSTDGETWEPQSIARKYLDTPLRPPPRPGFWPGRPPPRAPNAARDAGVPLPAIQVGDPLVSVYGTSDGKNVWAVSGEGTILHSTDGETWNPQDPQYGQLWALYGTGDGRSLWALGGQMEVLHSVDGETWKTQPIETAQRFPLSVYGTSDGQNVWVVGELGKIWHGVTANRAPYLKGADFAHDLRGTFLSLKLACPDPDSKPIGLNIIGWNAYKFKKKKEGSPIKVKDELSCGVLNLPVDLDDLEVSAGDWAYFDIRLDSPSTSITYHYKQKYDPWYWFIEHKTELYVLAAILSVLSTFLLLWVFHPLWNLRLYLALKQPAIDKSFKIPIAGPVLEFIFTLCTLGLPWFVAHSRTLDAWVAEHCSTIKRDWSEQSLPARGAVSERQRLIETTPYVPLPLRIGELSSGTLISRPTSDEIAKQFSEKRTMIQVIGLGGAGKTTFARQCGLWALMGGHPGGLRSYAMIPIWIDEDMATDKNPLSVVVNNRLAALLPDARIDDLFLSALLKKQRLLIIIDRLSERSVSTQEYLKNVYSNTRAEAIIITARNAVPVEGVTPVRLFPQSLNEKTLLFFMQALLQSQSSENHLDQAVPLDEQIVVAEKLSVLYRKSVRADGNVLPLPVRLFVGEAKDIIAASGSLDSLPQTIPDVYSRYLERVNPDNSAVQNFMSQSEMLRAAKILAKLSLSDDFIPKEFHAEDAATELKKEGWTETQKLDPAQRLLDNGILISKGELISRRFNFVLDPIAEYLAAAAYLEEARHDRADLDSLRKRAKHAIGFLTALDLLTGTEIKAVSRQI